MKDIYIERENDAYPKEETKIKILQRNSTHILTVHIYIYMFRDVVSTRYDCGLREDM